MNTLCRNIMKWQTKPAQRRADGVFIVEGIKMFREIPADRLQSIVVSESFLKGSAEEMAEVRRKLQESGRGREAFQAVPDEDFRRLSDTKTPQGVLAVLKAFDYRTDAVLNRENGLFILLENLQDPGNLGTILRSSEAAGVSAVIMNRECVDIYNSKVIRATMGSFFRVPFAVADSIEDVIRKIRKKGGKVYAAHLQDSVVYDTPDYRGMTAFVIGNESRGLTKKIADLADSYIKIPMCGQVESLNAAMAASILAFEAARQRRSAT